MGLCVMRSTCKRQDVVLQRRIFDHFKPIYGQKKLDIKIDIVH